MNIGCKYIWVYLGKRLILAKNAMELLAKNAMKLLAKKQDLHEKDVVENLL
tara:strand:- start:186 stop:338 length:153 start_codon:yes stop_codon:yes gene_type:complete